MLDGLSHGQASLVSHPSADSVHAERLERAVVFDGLRRPFRVCAESVIEKVKHLLGKDDSGNYRGDIVLARIFREYR